MMNIDREQLPSVDLDVLAKCLGLKEWPKDLRLCYHQRMAARVITDAFLPDHKTGEIDLRVSIYNATAWIEMAREEGYSAGREEERREWNTKIMELFGLR